MVKIIMHGCCGHMGQVISDLVAKDANAEIVAGIDVTDKGNTTYPVFTNIKECQTEADVLIDFSSAKAADALLDYCTERNLPVVLCTTGLSEEQLAKVEETAKKDSGTEICKHVTWYQHSDETDPGSCKGSCNSWI